MVNIDGSGRNRELSIQEEKEMEKQATFERMDKIYDVISRAYDKLADIVCEVTDFDSELGQRLDQLVDKLGDYHIAFGNKIYGTGDEDERGWEEC